ncbi:Bacteriocin-protection, YdeI or OmpD-Associated [Pseudoxanthomonas sp. GM95]|uniref:YdeI/OmpD-associated family protein n=1 Tax=Pseudoxanthomonas sp. GM95 TaxID=1881043 RepID=UPI0008D080B5|nr:YdeI/OmpD-associated family protein [Pseudoxanthomonas sp. GM95]SEM21572.1 Bacteriocin-protection, YdeI or OmpD-Associated [Pseudoxanthomonas sp. GM95]
MPKAPANVRFKAKLLRPALPADATWSFLLLPPAASAKLPTRSMVSVEGTLGEAPFQATLEPDGQGSHWLKVEDDLRAAAGIAVGDTVALAIAPMAEEPEPKVPADIREALDGHAAARATWDDITAIARRDWIYWIVSGKKAETRIKRIGVALDKLGKGNRRACCFDRSGMYSNSLSAPKAAP